MTQMTGWTQYLVTALVIGLVLILRLRRVGKVRRLRLETLWILPAIFFAVFGWIFYEVPPHGIGWLWCGIALVIGATVGWYRGRFVEISVDPETHLLNQKTSIGAIIFIVILIAVRMAMRSVVSLEAASWHLNALLVSGIFVCGAAGTLTAFRVELFLRARRLLAVARASRLAQ